MATTRGPRGHAELLDTFVPGEKGGLSTRSEGQMTGPDVTEHFLPAHLGHMGSWKIPQTAPATFWSMTTQTQTASTST